MVARWYVINVYSGFEGMAAEAIHERAAQQGLSELFEQILIPTEKVVVLRRGRKVEADHKLFPGYILIKVDLTDQVYYILRTIPKVTGLLGVNNKPTPIPDSEVMRIIQDAGDLASHSKAYVSFEVGEHVCVSDGPFASFNGIVEEVDNVRLRLKVAVSIFGRATPVELEYSQVDKV